MITEGFDIEDNGNNDKTKKPQKMGPDVSCFRVKTKDRPKALLETVQLWPVMTQDKLIVTYPGRHLFKLNVVVMFSSPRPGF